MVELTDIKGIGEATEKKIRNNISRSDVAMGREVSVNEATRLGNRDVARAELNEKQYSNLIGKVTNSDAKSEMPGPTPASQQNAQGVESTTTRVGDFLVGQEDRKKAFEAHRNRSPRAQSTDKRKRAPITTDFDVWESDPAAFDFPGVDTPGTTVRGKEKDRISGIFDEDDLLRDIFD